MRVHRLSLSCALVLGAAVGCESPSGGPPGTAPSPEGSSAAGAAAPAKAEPAKPPTPPLTREGQALARSPVAPVLWLADEDHGTLRRIPITEALAKPPPITDPPTIAFVDAGEQAYPMPGRPAQLVALEDRLLVTIRDPGLLLVLDAADPGKELARVTLPPDAWGIALSPDGSAAYVTSAWSAKLSKVDLGSASRVWTVDVAREPRGVAVAPDGRVYLSHLVGAELSVVDGAATSPEVRRIDFPADPSGTRFNETIPASLGYAALLSPDGRRLFVGRHGLGAVGWWQGSPTVDVYSTTEHRPIAPKRQLPAIGTLTVEDLAQGPWSSDAAGMLLGSSGALFQPRAMVYRKKTHHLIVASESTAQLVELDALSIAPASVVNRTYRLGGLAPKSPTEIQIPPHCGAPTGVVLDASEDVAFAYCRSTDNLVAVRLTPDGARRLRKETVYVERAEWKERLSAWGPYAYAKLAVEPMREDLALGRRLYYDALEPVVSGVAACSGCHPEGRDDGHVWRELPKAQFREATFVAGPALAPEPMAADEETPWGYARQTPMLAGRVDAAGPYGWHGESATLVDRVKAGFALHRSWPHHTDGKTRSIRAEPLAAFLREGLVPPPREARPLSEVEERGRAIFESKEAQCAVCHVPATGYTDRSAVPLRGFRAKPMFQEDPNPAYKVPSLRFVGGTAPYYHDASMPTLEALVNDNLDRMGKTSHLDAEGRAALIAFLRTL